MDPAARGLVPRSRALPAARPGRRDHRGPLPRRRGRRPGDRPRRPLRAARGRRGASPRIDPSRPATMYRGTMLSARELRRACGRSRTSCGSATSGASRPTGSCSTQGEVADRSRRPARRLHGRSACATRPADADVPARSHRPPAGAPELAVLQRRARRASSRPTATTTRTRTASARPTPTRAASRTGRGLMSRHVGDRVPVAERARPLRLDRPEPAQPAPRPARARGRAGRPDLASALPDERRTGDRPATGARKGSLRRAIRRTRRHLRGAAGRCRARWHGSGAEPRRQRRVPTRT